MNNLFDIRATLILLAYLVLITYVVRQKKTLKILTLVVFLLFAMHAIDIVTMVFPGLLFGFQAEGDERILYFMIGVILALHIPFVEFIKSFKRESDVKIG